MRFESDTYSMFHQVEGLVVDKDLNFAHLKNEEPGFWNLFGNNPR